MENLRLYEKFRAVPKDAQKTITGGRLNGFTDINPMWRIKTLTEAFGACGEGWYFKKTAERVVPGADKGEVAVFVDVELYYITESGEWSEPIYGTGGSMLVSNGKSGLYLDDEAFKKAYTDAQSVACKALGIGADIYWQKDSTKYPTNAQEPATEPTDQPQSTPESVAAETEKMRKLILDLAKSAGRDEQKTRMFAEEYIERITGAFVAWDSMTIGHLASVKVALAKRIENEKKK